MSGHVASVITNEVYTDLGGETSEHDARETARMASAAGLTVAVHRVHRWHREEIARFSRGEELVPDGGIETVQRRVRQGGGQ